MKLEWDATDDKFLQYVALSDNWTTCIDFWTSQDFRRARITVDVGFDIFDASLMMHEVPNWKQCAIYNMSPLFHQGCHIANQTGCFTSPVAIELWLGWFFVICLKLQLPTHPQVLWNRYVSFLHHFPDISTKRH